MNRRARTLRVVIAAVAVTGAWMVIGPDTGGAANQGFNCDAVLGEIRCFCPPEGPYVTMGPARDGEGQEIIYSPAAVEAACANVVDTTTTTTATTTPDTTTVTTTTVTTTPASPVEGPGTDVAGVTAAPSAGSTGSSAGSAASIRFTG